MMRAGVSNPYKNDDDTDLVDLVFRGFGCIAFIMIVLMNIEPDEDLLVSGQQRPNHQKEGRALVDIESGMTGGFPQTFITDDDDEKEGLSSKMDLKACIGALESTCEADESDGMKCVDCVFRTWEPLKKSCSATQREDVDALCWRNYQVDYATLADIVKVQPCVEAIRSMCQGQRGLDCVDCVQTSWTPIAQECDAYPDQDAENFVQALCWKHPSRTASLQDREIKAAREAAEVDQELLGKKSRQKREASAVSAMEQAAEVESEWG
jgi:phage tail protein X